MKDFCLYDLALYEPWAKFLKYPLGILFLIDFHFTWKSHQRELRGDFATNISSGLARFSGFIGRVIVFLLTIIGKK